jgi:hypothetical protein
LYKDTQLFAKLGSDFWQAGILFLIPHQLNLPHLTDPYYYFMIHPVGWFLHGCVKTGI